MRYLVPEACLDAVPIEISAVRLGFDSLNGDFTRGVYKFLGLLDIDETSRHDIGAGNYHAALAVDADSDDNETVLREMLSVSEHD